MSTGHEVYPIHIWVNEERYQRLQQAGLAAMAEEVLAGLKVIRVPATSAEKDALLLRFPTAKCDTATTRSIAMLPRAAKDQIFAFVVQKRSVNILGDFLRSLES
ncbi:MAG: hypothetical protein HY686_02625 [Chloroflexi bacterium]|nr:hypothetical protein [Chloroflexota bacterium]